MSTQELIWVFFKKDHNYTCLKCGFEEINKKIQELGSKDINYSKINRKQVKDLKNVTINAAYIELDLLKGVTNIIKLEKK